MNENTHNQWKSSKYFKKLKFCNNILNLKLITFFVYIILTKSMQNLQLKILICDKKMKSGNKSKNRKNFGTNRDLYPISGTAEIFFLKSRNFCLKSGNGRPNYTSMNTIFLFFSNYQELFIAHLFLLLLLFWK